MNALSAQVLSLDPPTGLVAGVVVHAGVEATLAVLLHPDTPSERVVWSCIDFNPHIARFAGGWR